MRPEKANLVSDLSEKLNRSPFLLVTDYQRMKVDDFGELRNRLAPTGSRWGVERPALGLAEDLGFGNSCGTTSDVFWNV